MKKISGKAFVALFVVFVAVMGCSKNGGNNAEVPLPNIGDFTIVNATAFAAGSTSTVNIYCSTLGSGTYSVHFDLTGSNTDSSRSATLVMNNNVGSFKTPVLNNAGETFLTLNSITNINGGGTAFVTNRTYTLSDSTGLMSAIVGGSTTFNAYDVLATLTGNQLTIRGTVPEPSQNVITLVIDSFTRTNGVINFSNYIVPEVAHALYQMPVGGFVSANGVINIITVQPVLSGTFSFTGMDSTKVTSGSFSCATPAL